MLVGRLPGGRIVVAYEDVEEIISQRSCYACVYYREKGVCGLYHVCRAGKKSEKMPIMFTFAGMEETISRMKLEIGSKDGLKRVRVHR